MIKCSNLSVGYGKRVIINNLCFTANENEITVILGKNGSGKTTLMKALSGISPYTGSISINGEELRNIKSAQRAKIIGFMPQMLKAPDITVRELVSFGRQPHTGFLGVLSDKDKSVVENILNDTGIISLADKTLNKISGGERQKAYFAMLMAQDCRILLLDEPGANLDTENVNLLSSFLLSEKGQGKTIITVFHDINRALSIADRIIVIDHSDLIFSGDRNAFCESNIPNEIFGLSKYKITSEDRYCNVKYFFA